MNQDYVLEGLINFLIKYEVELVLVNDRVTLRRCNDSLELQDVDVDLYNWILGE